MNQILTTAIVLKRTDFGEADRIVTVLTPNDGKLRLMAKGVRKLKSKLAGGIELFSISQLTYLEGKGEVNTLISSRLEMHYPNIIKKIERVQLGYELLKRLDRATEDEPEAEYFDLLQDAFEALDDHTVDLKLIQLWFTAQLLQLAGHAPNLKTDTTGVALIPTGNYQFDFDAMAFAANPTGRFRGDHIKTMRLLFGPYSSQSLNQVLGLTTLIPEVEPLVRTMSTTYLRI